MPPLTGAKNLLCLKLVPLSRPLLWTVVVQSYTQDPGWILCIVLHSIYILITLCEGELLLNIIISFWVFIYCNWVKNLLLFLWCSQEKVIPLKSLQFVARFYPTDICSAILNAMYWRVTWQWLMHVSSEVHRELGQVVHIEGFYFTQRMSANASKLHLLQVACLRGEAAVKFVGDKWLLRPSSKITALLLCSGFSSGKTLYTCGFTWILA